MLGGGDLELMFKRITIAQYAASKVKEMVPGAGRSGRSTSFTQIISDEETQIDVRFGSTRDHTQ